jgi:VanZ family protein
MPMRIATETRTRAAPRFLLFGWMVLIFALSSRGRLPQLADVPSEFVAVAGHFAIYAVLTALLWGVLPSQGWPARRRLGVAFVGAMAFGLSDEWHQSFVVGRSPAIFDLAVDAVGALSALVVIAVAARACGGMVDS